MIGYFKWDPVTREEKGKERRKGENIHPKNKKDLMLG